MGPFFSRFHNGSSGNLSSADIHLVELAGLQKIKIDVLEVQG